MWEFRLDSLAQNRDHWQILISTFGIHVGLVSQSDS
jgi:hypothetical protein